MRNAFTETRRASTGAAREIARRTVWPLCTRRAPANAMGLRCRMRDGVQREPIANEMSEARPSHGADHGPSAATVSS